MVGSAAQSEMFPLVAEVAEPRSASVEERVRHNKLDVKKATFKGGLDSQVHRWFRLTPSFGPELVHHVLDRFGPGKDSVILDPFCGAGTTLIECRKAGIESFGFEINPLLHFVGSTCLAWELDAEEGARLLRRLIKVSGEQKQRLAGVPIDKSGLTIPPIHNVYRWWRPDVLKEILILKESIDVVARATPWRGFFRLCLAGVLVPELTNVTLGRLQLHFIDRAEHEINAFPVFGAHARMMLRDVEDLAGRSHPSAVVVHTDATCPRVPKGKRADIVITSPPYPNRYSYVWNTRPHLYMLDFFTAKHEAADLDKKTIGGTWGTATSVLAKGIVEPALPIVGDVVGATVAEIRESDNLMANYVMKYFNLLAKQIVAMDAAVGRDVKLAYVVGNSCVKGTYIATDVLLGKIVEGLGLGYRTEDIERFRKRNSGVDLYETTVFASRG